MHDYVKNLAKVVRAAREEAHLSQAALPEQIGCDERTILNIENDRGNPKFEVLCQDHRLFTHSCRPDFPPRRSHGRIEKTKTVIDATGMQ